MECIKRLVALVFALSLFCGTSFAKGTVTIDKVVYEFGTPYGDEATIIESRHPTGTLTIPAEIEVNGWKFKVSEIKENVFNGDAFEKLILPGSLTYIGTGAFSDCHLLTEVTLQAGDKILEIYPYAFKGSPIRKLSLNRDLCDYYNNPGPIGGSATERILFGTNIRELEIGNSVTDISTDCFRNCTSLKSLKYPEH